MIMKSETLIFLKKSSFWWSLYFNFLMKGFNISSINEWKRTKEPQIILNYCGIKIEKNEINKWEDIENVKVIAEGQGHSKIVYLKYLIKNKSKKDQLIKYDLRGLTKSDTEIKELLSYYKGNKKV